MNLELFTPTRPAMRIPRAIKIIAEATHGVFCLLPRHIDMVAELRPGVLTWFDHDNQPGHAAIDGGTLVKSGLEVRVATHRAIAVEPSSQGRSTAEGLVELRRRVHEEFRQLDDRERKARSALARLESEFVRRFIELDDVWRAGANA